MQSQINFPEEALFLVQPARGTLDTSSGTAGSKNSDDLARFSSGQAMSPSFKMSPAG